MQAFPYLGRGVGLQLSKWLSLVENLKLQGNLS